MHACDVVMLTNASCTAGAATMQLAVDVMNVTTSAKIAKHVLFVTKRRRLRTLPRRCMISRGWAMLPQRGVLREVRATPYVSGYLRRCAGVCALCAYDVVVPLFVPSTPLYPSSLCCHGTSLCSCVLWYFTA
jgi:hypothetical protein